MKKKTTKKKSNIKIGYKAISKSLKDYCSWTATPTFRYYFDKWTERRPGFGPIAIFTTRKAAYKFVQEYSYGMRTPKDFIFKCEYVPSKDKFLWTPYNIKSEDIPEGTAFANKVRLLP